MIDLKDYPKSKEVFYEHVKKWLLQLQKELLKDVPEVQAPEITDRIVELGANNILNQNFRSLYHFFDEQGIYLLVDGPDEMHGWTWRIRYKSIDVFDSTSAGSLKREECEIEGFKECFKLMEKHG